jgi:CRP/FNR family cyclic AMP-dependent transcriptional regulator
MFTVHGPHRHEDVHTVAAVDSARVRAIPLFADLSEEDVEQLATAATELRFDAGATITQEGEFGHAVFAIERGTADVLSNEEVVGTVGPGDVIGEIAVLASGRRTATVVATSPVELIALFKRDVWALERRAPEVAERLRELVADHLEPAS